MKKERFKTLFLKFLEDINPFCRATDSPVLEFWWPLGRGVYVAPLVKHLLTTWQSAWQARDSHGARNRDLLCRRRKLYRLSYVDSARFRTYFVMLLLQYTLSPVSFNVNDEMMPPKSEQSTSLIQKLTAPPDAPHLSGRAMQASVLIPRSTHCLRKLLVDTVKFTCNGRNCLYHGNI